MSVILIYKQKHKLFTLPHFGQKCIGLNWQLRAKNFKSFQSMFFSHNILNCFFGKYCTQPYTKFTSRFIKEACSFTFTYKGDYAQKTFFVLTDIARIGARDPQFYHQTIGFTLLVCEKRKSKSQGLGLYGAFLDKQKVHLKKMFCKFCDVKNLKQLKRNKIPISCQPRTEMSEGVVKV